MRRQGDLLDRRAFMRGVGAAALLASTNSRVLAESYRRADTSWFAACRFGVSTHWTAQSQPVGQDDWVPFGEAVEHFDVAAYVDKIKAAGASYVIFTSTHALQMLPAPCAAIDQVAPGRTTRRDMLGDLADACHAKGLHLILYYNHSCNSGDDPAWEHAVGYHDRDKSRMVRNLLSILKELGSRYGNRVQGWWFDSCYSLDPRGYYNSVTTDMRGFQFPWEEWTAAAKAGFDQRIVSLSSGMLTHYLYSSHQDYEGGEANDLVAVATSQFTPDHLQAHRWVCLDNPNWVHAHVKTALAGPRWSVDLVADYVRTCNASKVPVTFNVDIDRKSMLSAESMALLGKVRDRIA